jgi:hypothetical protein
VLDSFSFLELAVGSCLPVVVCFHKLHFEGDINVLGEKSLLAGVGGY